MKKSNLANFHIAIFLITNLIFIGVTECKLLFNKQDADFRDKIKDTKTIIIQNIESNNKTIITTFIKNMSRDIKIDYEIKVPFSNITYVQYDIDSEVKNLNEDDITDGIIVNQNYCNFRNFLKKEVVSNKTSASKRGNFENKSPDNNRTQFPNNKNNYKKIKNVKSRKLKNTTLKTLNNLTLNTLNNLTLNTLNNQALNNSTQILLQNKFSNASDHPDFLLSVIKNQSNMIINELCSQCFDINNAVNRINSDIKIISVNIKKYFNSNLVLSLKEYSNKVSNVVNNINYIKADLFKINEILTILHKINCKNFEQNSKRYKIIESKTNKLVELIQSSVRNLNLDINLGILS